jgi:hypothetical protein
MKEMNQRNNVIPEAPGYEKIGLYKKNKASKGRVKVNPHVIKPGQEFTL